MKHWLSVFALVLVVSAGVAPVAGAKDLNHHERREINRLLDRFVPTAVSRRNPSAAARLVTPDLRSAATRREWRRGDIPVYPYPARGTRFHGWSFNYRTHRQIGISLYLQPGRGARVGPIAFNVALRRVAGHWLVDSFMPAAVYAPQGKKQRIIAPVDFGPGSGQGRNDPPRLGARWLFIPLGLLGLGALLAVAVPLFRWQQNRRAVRPL